MMKKKMIACAVMACVLSLGVTSGASAADVEDTTENIIEAQDSSDRIEIFPIYLGQGYCTGDGVRVRKGQGTNYAILGSLYKGDLINVYNVKHEVDGWTYITHGCDEHPHGLSGYMASQYVSDLDPARLETEIEENVTNAEDTEDIVFEIG